MGPFQIENQPWMLVDQADANLVTGSAAGVLGLGFDTLSATKSTPFWQALADSGTLAAPEMSFWFTRLIGDSDASAEEFGGIFTLGGRNQTLYTGDVEFLPLVSVSGRKTWWYLDVSGNSLLPCIWIFVPTRLNSRGYRQRKEGRLAA